MTSMPAMSDPVDQPVVVTRRGILFWTAVAILGIMVGLALFAPFLGLKDPYQQNLELRLKPPFWLDGAHSGHLLGTDTFGRDMLSRLVHGARISIAIGVLTVMVSAVVGTSLGLMGGYFGGRVDSVVMFLITARLSMPAILMALAAVTFLGRSIPVMIGVLGALLWDRFAVVTRTLAQQETAKEYVAAARAAGFGHGAILFRELLPNVLPALFVVATLEMGTAILLEAALSFLGLGVLPPAPSWGLMVNEGKDVLFFNPLLTAMPGFAIFLLVAAVSLIGDTLRDQTGARGR
jgi:peptide/nickel transport system permease protein